MSNINIFDFRFFFHQFTFLELPWDANHVLSFSLYNLEIHNNNQSYQIGKDLFHLEQFHNRTSTPHQLQYHEMQSTKKKKRKNNASIKKKKVLEKLIVFLPWLYYRALHNSLRNCDWCNLKFEANRLKGRGLETNCSELGGWDEANGVDTARVLLLSLFCQQISKPLLPS